MDLTTFNFWGKTKYWWALMLLGILIIPCGIWLLLQPIIGYAVISIIFGWLLIIAGVLQIAISANVGKKIHGWGWWLAGGIIDIFIGFLLLGNMALSETTLPFFFAFAFLFKGISNLISAFTMTQTYKYWWLYLINGIFMIVVAWLFLGYPFSAAYTIVFLSSFIFVYWGITLIAFSLDLKPGKEIKE